MELTLINFRCWKSKTFYFTENVNLLSGVSGSGKSTICEAIFFCLYGGMNNIHNISEKKDTTKVIMQFNEYSISRSKPPENISITIYSEKDNKILNGIDAQSWINSNFGSKDLWIASSYLSQSCKHFLMTESNSKKMDLLSEITFGDLSEINQPDYYLNILSEHKDSLHKEIDRLQTTYNIKENIIKKFKEKYEKHFVYGFITVEQNDKNEKKLKKIEQKLETDEKILSKIKEYQIKYQSYQEIIEDLRTKNIQLDRENDDINLEILIVSEEISKIIKHISEQNQNMSRKTLEVLQNEIDGKNKELKSISFEFHNIQNIISKYDKLCSELVNLEKELQDIYLSQQINQDIFFTKEHLLEKLNKEEKKLNFLLLKNKVENIDPDILTYDENIIMNHKTFYDKLIKCLQNEYNFSIDQISDFSLQEIKDLVDDISLENENYLNREKEIKLIKEKNDKLLMEFSMLKENYVKYQNRKNKIDKIKQHNDGIQLKISEVSEKIIQINNNDDYSVEYVLNNIKELHEKISISDITCPHCNGMLSIQKGKIIKGVVSEKEVSFLKDQLHVMEFQLEYRRKKMNLLSEIIVNNDEIEAVEEPIKPILENIDNEYLYINFDKINILMIYNKTKSLYDSLPHKKTYNEYLNLKDEMEEFVEQAESSIEQIKNNIKELNNSIHKYTFLENKIHTYKKDQIKLQDSIKNYIDAFNQKFSVDTKDDISLWTPLVEEKILSLENNISDLKNEFDIVKNIHDKKSSHEYKLKTLNDRMEKNHQIKIQNDSKINQYLSKLNDKPEDPRNYDDIFTQISSYKKDISSLNKKLEAYKIITEYFSLESELEELSNDINTKIKKVECLIIISKTVSELGSKYLDDVVNQINIYSREILSELFNLPINVNLSTHKTLKTKNEEKLQINFSINYNGTEFDKSTLLSGGEQERISLALLLTFSKINSSRICILDEVMSSLDGSLREKGCDLIKKWTEGKIVISICHEIVKGWYDNIIEL